MILGFLALAFLIGLTIAYSDKLSFEFKLNLFIKVVEIMVNTAGCNSLAVVTGFCGRRETSTDRTAWLKTCMQNQ